MLLFRFFLIVDPVEEQGEDDPQLLCSQRGSLIAQLLQYLSHAKSCKHEKDLDISSLVNLP